MGAEFTFHYFPSDSRYEIEETSSDLFISLFDVDLDFLKHCDAYPSFVQEYREYVGETAWEREFFGNQRKTNRGTKKRRGFKDWNLQDMKWGPSSPFAPDEVHEWAHQWINFVQNADEESLCYVFLYNIDHGGKLNLDREAAINDLQQLAAQAKCAHRNQVSMTVEAQWS